MRRRWRIVPGGDKGGSQKPRTRGVELEERLDAVEKLITVGYTSREIRKACHEQWKLSPRQADEYVSKVYRRWEAEREQSRPQARARQLRRLMKTLRDAASAKDLRAVVAVEQLLTRIEGTEYQPSDDLPSAAGNARIVIKRRGPDEEAS